MEVRTEAASGSLRTALQAELAGAGIADHRVPASRKSSPSAWLKRLPAFMGPGYLIAVGYIDPGNWATDLAAGSGFGYSLLWVIMLSNLMAILLQILAARLGIATGLDLAQACRAHASPFSAKAQWLVCEIAICACDLAEVIGTAIALDLLFGIPIAWGVALTALDVVLVFYLQSRGYRYVEAMVMALLALIFLCFAAMLVMAQPAWGEVARGLIPAKNSVTDPRMLYLAVGISGATVMPHNLYLHSSIVKQRLVGNGIAEKKEAIRFATADIVIALLLAFFINASILVMSSAVFHRQGHFDVAEIQEAHRLMTPLLGTTLASFLFGLALLASGHSSTITATLAGQIVMEGFLNIRLPAWMRRLLTRSLAIVPALCVAAWYGQSGIGKLLVLSQVVLSLQLPFAVFPLVRFTSSRARMGQFVSARWVTVLACAAGLFIAGLNISIMYQIFSK